MNPQKTEREPKRSQSGDVPIGKAFGRNVYDRTAGRKTGDGKNGGGDQRPGYRKVVTGSAFGRDVYEWRPINETPVIGKDAQLDEGIIEVRKPPSDATAKFSDPTKRISASDYDAYKEFRENTPSFKLKNAPSTALAAAGAVIQDVSKGAAALGSEVARGNLGRVLQSTAEGIARGTADLGILASMVGQKASKATSNAPKAIKSNLRQLGLASQLASTESQADKLSEATQDLLKKFDPAEALMRVEFEQFRKLRELERMRELARRGDQGILENALAIGDKTLSLENVNDRLAEGVSYVADASTLAGPAGAVGGRVVRTMAKGGQQAVKAAERGAAAVGGRLEAAGQFAEETPGLGTAVKVAGAAMKGAARREAPIASRVAGVARRAVQGAEGVAETVLGGVAKQPSQVGIIESVAKSGAVPESVRKAASRIRGLDPALSLGRDAVEGGFAGAAVGAGLGGLAGGAEGFFAGIGSGGVLGAGGAAVSGVGRRASGAQNRAAVQADIGREVEIQRERFGEDSARVFQELPQPVQADITAARAIFGDGLDIRVLSSEQAAQDPRWIPGAAAYFDPVNRRISIVGDIDGVGARFHHELGEAIWHSPSIAAVDLRMHLFDGPNPLFSADQRATFARDYARRFVEAEKGAKASKQEIDAWIERETEARGADWDLRELFAEAVAANTIDGRVADLRRGRIRIGMDNALRKTLLRGKALALRMMGAELDATGKPTSDFRGIGGINGDPAVRKIIERMTRDVDTYFLETRRSDANKTFVNIRRSVDHPSVGLRPQPDGTMANDFAKLNSDGTVTFASVDTVRKIERGRAKEMKDLVKEPGAIPFRPDGDSLLGRRGSLNNPDKIEMRGTRLPDSIRSAPSLENKVWAIDAMENAIQSGERLRGWYHAVGTGLDWWKSVRQRGGNIPAAEYEWSPFEFTLSKVGNLSVRAIDMDHVVAKANELRRLNRLGRWGNDVDSFLADVQTYVDNHKAGRSGGTGIGDAKKRDITAFFDLANDETKTFRQAFNSGTKTRIFKTVRIDRIASIDQTGQFFPFDQDLTNVNFSPKVSQGPKPPPFKNVEAPAIVSPKAKETWASSIRIDTVNRQQELEIELTAVRDEMSRDSYKFAEIVEQIQKEGKLVTEDPRFLDYREQRKSKLSRHNDLLSATNDVWEEAFGIPEGERAEGGLIDIKPDIRLIDKSKGLVMPQNVFERLKSNISIAENRLLRFVAPRIAPRGVRVGLAKDRQGNVVDRAEYYLETKSINLAPNSGVMTVMHEYGHAIEHNTPEIALAANEFLERRRRVFNGVKEQEVHLSQLIKGVDWEPDEFAFQDDWENRGGSAYSGKIYGRTWTSAHPPTEILSTGIERLLGPQGMQWFAKQDPDFFDFVVNTLRLKQ